MLFTDPLVFCFQWLPQFRAGDGIIVAGPLLLYRPVVFELMPPAFTLLQLQQTVEALAGVRLHKPNFRRLVQQQGLVEETGAVTLGTGGRPARLVRFRREALVERPAPGLRVRARGGARRRAAPRS